MAHAPRPRAGLTRNPTLAHRSNVGMARCAGWLAVLSAAGALHACQCAPRSTGDDAGTADAAALDASRPDASALDGAVGDAALPMDAATPRDAGGGDANLVTPMDASPSDAAPVQPDAAMADAAAPLLDAAVVDAAVADASAPGDAAPPPPDAGGAVDAGPQHVHIFISNTCETSVDPPQVTVPPDVDAYFVFHNHSVDYAADVWMSYGGGFLDLAPGQSWADPIRHCLGPNAHQEYGDISIAGGGSGACPGVRFLVNCQ